MRTTITLDPDVDRLLRDAVHRARRPFKAVLNDALRAGLDPARTQTRPKAYRVPARSLRLRAGLYPAGLNRLVDDLEADVAAVRAIGRSRA